MKILRTMLTFTNDSRANSFLLALPEFCSQDDYSLKSRLIESVFDSLCKAYGRSTVRSVVGRFFSEWEFLPRRVPSFDFPEEEVDDKGVSALLK